MGDRKRTARELSGGKKNFGRRKLKRRRVGRLFMGGLDEVVGKGARPGL